MPTLQAETPSKFGIWVIWASFYVALLCKRSFAKCPICINLLCGGTCRFCLVVSRVALFFRFCLFWYLTNSTVLRWWNFSLGRALKIGWRTAVLSFVDFTGSQKRWTGSIGSIGSIGSNPYQFFIVLHSFSLVPFSFFFVQIFCLTLPFLFLCRTCGRWSSRWISMRMAPWLLGDLDPTDRSEWIWICISHHWDSYGYRML